MVDHKYLWLCFALALWGLGQGAGPVVEALLADSTRTGQLPRLEVTQTAVTAINQSVNHRSPSGTILSTKSVRRICSNHSWWLSPCPLGAYLLTATLRLPVLIVLNSC